MRTKNSIKNIYINIISQIIIILLGFISRKVFLDNLGTQYLGVNGLLTNVLSLLSLAEGGIGTSIIYNLYKPLAKDNKDEVIALVQLYKKIYGILAIIVFIIGISIYPFLGIIMNGDVNIPNLLLVYLIFIIKNVISYLNAHKWSLINADQKGYVLARVNLIFNIIITISKIIILKVTQDYVLYLIVELIIFIAQNIWNGRVVNIRYPYIKTNKKYKVKKETRENLIINVKALFLHNIGGYCVFGTDNLLIGGFINVITVGLYSNYTMIIGQLNGLITNILYGIGSSVGNLIAIEKKEKVYEIFKVVNFISFWIYSVGSIALYNLIEPFIDWAFGEGLLLDKLSLIILLINFYLTGMRVAINIFKSKAGIFSQDKYVPLLEASINLGSSIILVKFLGLAGIFLGTTISTISIPLWTQSKIVYNQIFNKSVKEYFKRYSLYIGLTLMSLLLVSILCKVVVISSKVIEIMLKGIISISIPSLIYIIVFFKTKEFEYILSLIKPSISKINFKFKNILSKSI